MKEKILIIEPEQKDRNDLQDYLSAKYEITFAAEIQEAIDSIRKKLHKVIIYDLDNPKSKVITDLMRLKKSIEDIPIITITSVNSLEAEKTIRGIGVFYYLLKPYQVRDLDKLINAAVHLWDRKFKYQKAV